MIKKASLSSIILILLTFGCVTPGDGGKPAEPVVSKICPDLIEIVSDKEIVVTDPCYDGLISKFEYIPPAGYGEDSAYITDFNPTCILKLSPKHVPVDAKFVEIILDGTHQGYYEALEDIFLPRLVGKKQIFLVFTNAGGARIGSLHKYILNFGG